MALYLIIILQVIYAQGDQLLLVQALWRHGARYPINCNWGCEELKSHFEQLTPTGMRQHYNLGSWIRQRYIINQPFLSATFNENEMHVQSTNYNRYDNKYLRTIMSAYSNLQGMFPFGTGPDITVDEQYLLPPIKDIVTPDIFIGNEALPKHISVIPIHVQDVLDDYILHGYGYPTCPKAADMYYGNIVSDMYKSINNDAEVQKLIEQFKSEVDVPEKNVNISVLFSYTDTFFSDKWNNFPLPPRLTKDTYDQLDRLSALVFQLEQFQTWDQVKILSSPFMKNLVDNMQATMSKTNQYKYMAYSAHDTTVQLILSALNLTSSECIRQAYFNEKVDNPNCIYTVFYHIIKYPGFASNIIFELYNSSNNIPYIKVLVNGTYVNICSGGGTTCALEHFKTAVLNQQADFMGECGLTKLPQVDYQIPWWAMLFMIMLILLLIIGIVLLVVIKRRLSNTTTNPIPFESEKTEQKI